MKIALVNQPIGRVRPIGRDEPFSGGSITLWNYHMARELSGGHHPVVLTRGQGSPGRHQIHGLDFEFVDGGRDESRARGATRRNKLLNLIGWPRNYRRPYYASENYYRTYAENIARHLRAEAYDLVTITNYSHLVPTIRRLNPEIGIHLHMQCEWLNQLDAGLLRNRLAACDHVSGCSQFIVDQACKAHPGLAAKSFSLLNGANTEAFHPVARSAETGDLEIIYVGRVSPEKGIHFLLEAFNEVVEQVPNARLTLIGGRSPAPYDYIVALDPDPLVQDMARFYGRGGSHYISYLDTIPTDRARSRLSYVDDVPQDHLLEAYQRAAVFVFPSAWNEPFGMPIIEAMACATPVVSTYSGGIPEFVADRSTGLLVERGSAAGLRDAFLSLLGDADLRRQIGEAGRAYVAGTLTWKDVAARYLSALT